MMKHKRRLHLLTSETFTFDVLQSGDLGLLMKLWSSNGKRDAQSLKAPSVTLYKRLLRNVRGFHTRQGHW